MSADNGIYILQCKDQYRVRHLQAVEDLWWSEHLRQQQNDIVPLQAIRLFGQEKYTRDFRTAMFIAGLLLKKTPVCEYGIQIIKVPKSWSQLLHESKCDKTHIK